MNRVNKIIREEIEKFILQENINFNNLANYGQKLESLVQELARYKHSASHQDINNFLDSLMYFALQIVFAIQRCVNAQSLNESLGSGLWNVFGRNTIGAFNDNNLTNLSSYGINVPHEINFWQNAKRGYYDTKRHLNNSQNNSYQNKKGTNNNTVQSKQLAALLQQDLPIVQKNYQKILTKYGNFKIETPKNILQTIYEINQEYTNLIKQSQGNV